MKTKLHRRAFLGAGAATAAMLAAPMVRGAGKPRVVVVGGGAGGATAARYIAKDSKGEIEVTLIEPNDAYRSCFFSNLYLGGFRDWASLAHGYGGLEAAGVTMVHDWAKGVDRAAKTVALSGGGAVPYDKLILSPGIDFVEGSVPGWSEADVEAMPHAYKGGTQELLKAQIEAMRPGGVFVMVAPPNSYRCPPGPYERVSMVAHVLKAKNPTAKIIIVDPKEKYSKQALFEEGWQAHYPGMIERLGPDFGGDKVEARPGAMEVVVDGEVIKADVCNIIAGQRAGGIAAAAGLTDASGWAPVEPNGMASRMDPDVHVLGDAALQGDMPKSGFAANSQAKVCANAVRGALTGSKVFPARYSNTCWSLIAAEDGVKVGANYAPADDKIASTGGFISQTGEDAALRKQTWEESLGWYAGITADIFG